MRRMCLVVLGLVTVLVMLTGCALSAPSPPVSTDSSEFMDSPVKASIRAFFRAAGLELTEEELAFATMIVETRQKETARLEEYRTKLHGLVEAGKLTYFEAETLYQQEADRVARRWQSLDQHLDSAGSAVGGSPGVGWLNCMTYRLFGGTISTNCFQY